MLTLEPTTRFESLAVDTMHHQLFTSAQNSFLGTDIHLAAKNNGGPTQFELRFGFLVP